eukprot:CAMPEP_0194569522 /NCGR_PEP_ID=MMETSP0292-20121207/7200_1 /TAXON_ID=39354 /ORGANISM="Heterosigma akashiwo, Strain CCMP2393" /LENGTH=155 /DNA_ID=CAMNT_0039419781 /DNA_START=223 /DNA_END=690 /DNA_ORIENTATION=-
MDFGTPALPSSLSSLVPAGPGSRGSQPSSSPAPAPNSTHASSRKGPSSFAPRPSILPLFCPITAALAPGTLWLRGFDQSDFPPPARTMCALPFSTLPHSVPHTREEACPPPAASYTVAQPLRAYIYRLFLRVGPSSSTSAAARSSPSFKQAAGVP